MMMSKSEDVLVSGTKACFQNTILGNFIPQDSIVVHMIIWNMNNRGNERGGRMNVKFYLSTPEPVSIYRKT